MGLKHGIVPMCIFCVGADALGGGGVLISAVEVSQLCGIDSYYTGPFNGVPGNVMICGAAAEDFNRDGWTDLFILGGAQQKDRLYICLGPDAFGNIQYEDQSDLWGIGPAHMGAGVSVADFDNDGYLDVYVTSHGDANGRFAGNHQLYRNQGPDEFGQFSFVDVADSAGVRFTSANASDGYSSSWGDIDIDGDLDLIVGGWTESSGGNKLFRNDGDGTFTDITASAIDIDLIDTHGFTPRFVDVTGNGALDLIIAADYNTSKLLLNDGTGLFHDVTDSAGVNDDSNGMGSTAADVNNDGLIDWYVSSIKAGSSTVQNGNKLYMNQGGGVFVESAISAGVDDGGWGWGLASGDLDHDGDVDLVETNGWLGSQWLDEQSYLYMNDGDGTSFTEQSLQIGVDNTGLGRGSILFDHDNDGDLDIAFVSSDIQFALYRNDALAQNQNHWVQIHLDTSRSKKNAPDGIGAHVIITTGSVVQHRWVQANSGYLSQGPIMAHAGLADATTIDRIEIVFPSGATRVIENVAVDASYTFSVCDADITGDALIDVFDVFAFISAYNALDPGVDFTDDGSLDIFDVFGFIGLFNDGCPGDL